MLNRLKSCFFLLFAGTVGHAQDTIENTPYHLPSPDGWGSEQFPVPIGFAPEIPYTGVEDIRFAPGWADAESEQYWTYAFLWYIDRVPKLNAKTIAKNIASYYTGLISVNADSSFNETTPVNVVLEKVPGEAGDLATFKGSVTMTDYMHQKTIVLNCRVHLQTCEANKKTVLFFELSPQPFTHENWSALDLLWKEFTCGAD